MSPPPPPAPAPQSLPPPRAGSGLNLPAGRPAPCQRGSPRAAEGELRLGFSKGPPQLRGCTALNALDATHLPCPARPSTTRPGPTRPLSPRGSDSCGALLSPPPAARPAPPRASQPGRPCLRLRGWAVLHRRAGEGGVAPPSLRKCARKSFVIAAGTQPALICSALLRGAARSPLSLHLPSRPPCLLRASPDPRLRKAKRCLQVSLFCSCWERVGESVSPATIFKASPSPWYRGTVYATLCLQVWIRPRYFPAPPPGLSHLPPTLTQAFLCILAEQRVGKA